ncbi:hypothetical protein IHV25_07550 [Phaeovibrio sulfidiphilus]|uniref:Uncharacterized protein n=1 Tax=Phaeovibrio sulfidiphilus TaxID=1220600 RepID=A0A8J7CWH8_9PROT|nr:hypothetical protein [Phaeovibrio sulfidiphilus]MBE1237501.1 hypothetical protein [Phaeovibrio sulfidiphilus]
MPHRSTRILSGLLACALAAGSAAGCAAPPACPLPAPVPSAPGLDSHNARNALDWDGLYVGASPEDTLTLFPDGRYVMSGARAVLPPAGAFDWDPSGSRILLPAGDRPAAVFFVGEGFVRQICPQTDPGAEPVYRKAGVAPGHPPPGTP